MLLAKLLVAVVAVFVVVRLPDRIVDVVVVFELLFSSSSDCEDLPPFELHQSDQFFRVVGPFVKPCLEESLSLSDVVSTSRTLFALLLEFALALALLFELLLLRCCCLVLAVPLPFVVTAAAAAADAGAVTFVLLLLLLLLLLLDVAVVVVEVVVTVLAAVAVAVVAVAAVAAVVAVEFAQPLDTELAVAVALPSL